MTACLFRIAKIHNQFYFSDLPWNNLIKIILYVYQILPMKFLLYTATQSPAQYWNGKLSLPEEIQVVSPSLPLAEFQLLGILCSLHGHMSPFDLLTGSESNSEKDRDIIAVLTAFQWYLYPRMPLTHYTADEKRISASGSNKRLATKAIDPATTQSM